MYIWRVLSLPAIHCELIHSAEQGNLDMLKRELDQVKKNGGELRGQAAQNKVGECHGVVIAAYLT